MVDFNIFKMSCIPLKAQLYFQQPLLQSLMRHDPSEIILMCWFGAQEIFLIIINAGNSCAA